MNLRYFFAEKKITEELRTRWMISKRDLIPTKRARRMGPEPNVDAVNVEPLVACI